MTTFLQRVLIVATLLLPLAACSPPAVPDVTYFRLPPLAPLPHANAPLTALPIEVEVFAGEGIYAEQALIYSASPDGGSLRTYHYHLWSEPPTRGLQTRLTEALRASGISALVTDRLPASEQALRVHGRLVRYERVERGEKNFEAQVAIEFRVGEDTGEPVSEQTYSAQAAASDATIAATVRAFGAAVDEVFAKFYADLAKLGHEAHAG